MTPRSARDQARDEDRSKFEGSSPAALPLSASEERQWATLAHFGALLGCIPSLIIYSVFRSRGPFTAQESKEALNFTLPLTVLAIIFNVLTLIPHLEWIFAILAVVLWVLMTLWGAWAAIQTSKGRPYRYAVNLRLIK